MPRTHAAWLHTKAARWWWLATAAGFAVGLSFIAAPAALSYDPEAWLVWGRELVERQLDVTAGPAIKPLPIGVNAVFVALAGSDAAWVAWAVVSRGALLLGVVLGARVAASSVCAERWWWSAGALAVVATPTLLEGALGGGAEVMAAASMLGACLLCSAGRLAPAAGLLAGAALLRPEALVLTGLIGVLWVWRHRPGVARVALSLGVVGAVPALWIGLQWAGGGALAGGAAAATALREGQPGLAARPALATLGTAAFVAPALLAAAASAWWASRVRAVRSRAMVAMEATGGQPGATTWAPATWALGLGGLWVATVALMAELGFSGEARYLSPGLTLLLVGALGVIAAAAPARQEVSGRGAAIVVSVVVSVAIVAAAIEAAPAVRDHRALARAERDLSALMERPSVRADAASCSTVAVPRFMRPAVAWRLDRSIGSLQSPRLIGAACALQRDARNAVDAQGPGGQSRSKRATSGAWSWWRADPIRGERRTQAVGS